MCPSDGSQRKASGAKAQRSLHGVYGMAEVKLCYKPWLKGVLLQSVKFVLFKASNDVLPQSMKFVPFETEPASGFSASCEGRAPTPNGVMKHALSTNWGDDAAGRTSGAALRAEVTERQVGVENFGLGFV